MMIPFPSRQSEAPLADDKTLPESVAAVYRSVTFGVLAAWAASILFVLSVGRAGYITPERGGIFVGIIGACALLHIALARFYWRSATRISAAPRWGQAFALVSLLEGIAWGLAPVLLISQDKFDVQLIALVTTLGICTGAVAAFSPYLPAFLALFIPTILPFAITVGLQTETLHQSVALLTGLFIAAIGAFGIILNRSFRNLVGLRLHAEALAANLSEQIKIAEAANRAKSSFLAAASHDLRQPVHALGLFVGALRGMPMSPQAVAILEQIESSSQAMDDLFAALLDISRLDAGTVEAHPENFAIGPMIERICRDHAQDAQDKGIGLSVLPCSLDVRSDPIHVERILRNLVSNAVRYTRTGRVVVGCRRRNDAVRVEVIDTGEGIAAAEQSRIFEEYYQVGNAERDRAKGLGLGLAIVRRLSDLIGCPLKLSSHVGRGSRFAMTLPLAGADSAKRRQTLDVAGALARGLIVVIDDELAIREAMTRLLTDWGHEIIVASSGDEALRRLSASPVCPDLIICDYRLRADENGIAVIERLRAEYNRTVPAMLITGDTAPDRLVEARRSGLLLLHKPVSNAKLRAAIVNLMRAALVEDGTDVDQTFANVG